MASTASAVQLHVYSVAVEFFTNRSELRVVLQRCVIFPQDGDRQMKRSLAGTCLQRLCSSCGRLSTHPASLNSRAISRAAFRPAEETLCTRPTHLPQPLHPPSSPTVLLCGPPARSFARAAVAAKPDLKEGTSARYAYTLDGVTKRFPTGRTLFSNLRLAFYDGAKIGVLGVNGSGQPHAHTLPWSSLSPLA